LLAQLADDFPGVDPAGALPGEGEILADVDPGFGDLLSQGDRREEYLAILITWNFNNIRSLYALSRE
jgi:hypothetical protein